MNSKPKILVIGATGAQGGSVARALLRDGKFSVRTLIRNINTASAQALQVAGAELVQGDLADVATLQSALRGCYGVFGVTNYWEHFEKEYKLGKNLVDAVKASNIQHFIFSTQPDYARLTNGIIPVPQADIKAALQDYAIGQNVAVTFVQMTFYYENFLSLFQLQKAHNDRAFHFGFPQGDTPMAMASVSDLGGVVRTIFDYPEEYLGRTVGVVAEDRPCRDYAAIFSKVLGFKVQYDYVPHELFINLGHNFGVEWANQFEVQRLCFPCHQLSLIESYGLNPGMQTFEKWLIRHKTSFKPRFDKVEKRAIVEIY